MHYDFFWGIAKKEEVEAHRAWAWLILKLLVRALRVGRLVASKTLLPNLCVKTGIRLLPELCLVSQELGKCSKPQPQRASRGQSEARALLTDFCTQLYYEKCVCREGNRPSHLLYS